MNKTVMFSIILLFFCSLPASAKTIVLTLNEVDQKAMLQILDGAVRAGGLRATEQVAHILNMMQTAPALSSVKPVPESGKTKPKPKPEKKK